VGAKIIHWVFKIQDPMNGSVCNSDPSRSREPRSRCERLLTMAPNRLVATGFWLTYSQSMLTKEEVLANLKDLGTLKRACVCLETHQDGGKHIHALAEYARKKDVSPKHFDLKDEHPNVIVWDRVVQYEQWLVNHWNYCHKEDESPLTVGDVPEISRKRTRNEVALECVEVARTEGVCAAQQHALKTFAADYCKAVSSYDKVFMREANAKQAKPARELDTFPNAPTPPENWRTIFLWGKTGCGKTQYARALLPKAKVVRHASQLAECRFSDGIIFDDFSVCHWPATSVIALLDWDVESGINVKYGCVTIPAETRKIFTYNGDLAAWCRPRGGMPSQFDRGDEMTDEQFAAVKRRFSFIHEVVTPLYGTADGPATVDPLPSVTRFPTEHYERQYAMFTPAKSVRQHASERFAKSWTAEKLDFLNIPPSPPPEAEWG